MNYITLTLSTILRSIVLN